LRVKPYEDLKTNALESFNEGCILVGVYHLIPMTDYLEDENMRFNVGWSINLLVLFQILVNTLVLTYY